MNLSKENLDAVMEKNWKKVLFSIIICIIFFELFLTQDVDFFWEDYYLLGFRVLTPLGSVRVYDQGFATGLNEAETIFSNFFNPSSTFVMVRHGVNMLPFYRLFGSFLGDTHLSYRIVSLMFLSYFIFLIFTAFRKSNELFFGVLAIISYISFPQIWQVIVYPTWLASTFVMHVFTVSALYLFYFFYQQDLSRFKTAVVFLSIVSLTRLSMLIKEEGRLVFGVILLYFIITDVKKVKEVKNIVLLLSLLLTTYPFSSGLQSFTPHLWDVPTAPLLDRIILNAQTLSFVYGIINLLMVGFVLVFCLCLLYSWRKKHGAESLSHNMKLTIFSFLWFCAAMMMPVLSKGLSVYTGPQSWLIVDFFYSLFPFLIFLFTGLSVVFENISIQNKNKMFLLILLLIFFSLSFKFIALNRFVGAHRVYFIGYDTVADYLEATGVTNSTILFPFDGFTTAAQINTPSNYISSMSYDQLQNVTLLDATKGNLSHLYIISNAPLEFSEPERMVVVQAFKPRTNSVYAKAKTILGRDASIPTFYLYELQ